LGFDPMIQIIHEDDVVEALAHVTINDVPGVFNVAAEGAMPLRRLMALCGKLSLPIVHPLAYWGVETLKGSGFRIDRYVPIELDYLRYPWVGDLTKMREELGFTPRYTAEEALREFAERQQLHRYMSKSAALAYDQERLRATIERRRRAREQGAATAVEEEGKDNE
jgi:UDP-glucose 4-epimerase